MDHTAELLERLKNNADAVRRNIEQVCAEAGRDASEVTLIGVSKVFPVEYAEAAFAGGLKDLVGLLPRLGDHLPRNGARG